MADLGDLPKAVERDSKGLPWLDAETVRRLTVMPALIEALRQAFRSAVVSPMRHAHDIGNDSMLLLMPARESMANRTCRV